MNNSSLKDANTKALQTYVLSHPGTSRVEIAKSLGLSKMTVTNIVTRLLAIGYLEERDESQKMSKGRPAKGLYLSSNSPKLIGIYVSKSSVTIAFLDFSFHILSKKTFQANEEALPDLLDEIDRIARENLNVKIVGIALSSPGDSSDKSEEKGILSETDLLRLLNEKYPLPVLRVSALEAEALMELQFGSLKDVSEGLFIEVGEHLQAIIVHEGKILSLPGQSKAEFGHISIDYNGLSCECGNRGCIEAYASTSAMEKKLRDITKLKIDFRGFCELQSKKNDSRIDWALKDMMDKLAAAFIAYVNLLHPSVIVLSGEGAYLPDRYLSRLEKTVSEKARVQKGVKVPVRKPATKADAALLGSIIPAINQILTKSF